MFDFIVLSIAAALGPIVITGLWAWLGRDSRARPLMKWLTIIFAILIVVLLPLHLWPNAYCDPAYMFGYQDCTILWDGIASLGALGALLIWAASLLVLAVAMLSCAVFEAQRIVNKGQFDKAQSGEIIAKDTGINPL